MSDEIDEIKAEEQKKLNAAFQEAEETSAEPANDGAKTGWIAGLALILLGLFFLLGNFFSFNFAGNWWAIFIFIPAVHSLSRAWSSYRRHGRLTERASNNLIGGLLIGTVGFIFLFGLNFGNWWPLFLIIIGFGALLKARA